MIGRFNADPAKFIKEMMISNVMVSGVILFVLGFIWLAVSVLA